MESEMIKHVTFLTYLSRKQLSFTVQRTRPGKMGLLWHSFWFKGFIVCRKRSSGWYLIDKSPTPLKFPIQTHYAQEPQKQQRKHPDKWRHLKAQGRTGYQGINFSQSESLQLQSPGDCPQQSTLLNSTAVTCTFNTFFKFWISGAK